MKFIISRMPCVTHYPFFEKKCDLHYISVESFTATRYAEVLPICHNHPILPSPNTYLLLIYSTKDTWPYREGGGFNGFSKESIFVLALSWRSSTRFWHMDLLRHIKCFLWAGKMCKMNHRHLFFGLHLRIPHLKVSLFQTHGSFADKVNKPSRALMQSPLSYSPTFTDCTPWTVVILNSLEKSPQVISISLTACPQSHLPSLYHYCWYLFDYLLLLAHIDPITLFPFGKQASLFVCFSG